VEERRVEAGQPIPGHRASLRAARRAPPAPPGA
jgi:hypothetical protein